MLANPILSPLRSAFEAKRADAQEAWQAFESERDRLVQAGTDLTKDASALRKLDDLHGAYKQAADEATDLEQRMLRAIDGKAETMPGEVGRDGMRSIGQQFLKGLGVGGIGLKALDGTSGGTMVGPFFDPAIRSLPQRSLFVRSLIPVVQADSDKVWYLRQSVATQNAEPVAAGALKPTSVYTVERIEQPVTTIAHLTEPLDRALLLDFEELTSFLDTQLRLGVLLAEENQILQGDGISPHFQGILNTAGIQTQARGTDSQADAIYKAVVKLRLQFMEPDGIVLHPSDWQTIRLSKDGQGNYLAGTVVQSDPDRLFGIQIYTSPVLAQGTGLVGAFALGAQVWDREEARITFAESGALGAGGNEIFSRNEIVFRAEERIAFGVIRPAAFCTVTGL